jgi:hypothetical protein
MMRISTLLIAAGLALSGCATVTRGTTEEVRVEVDPPDASITSTIGHSCTGIPCKIQAPRKTEFTVTASKPGYKPQSIFVGTSMSGGGAAGLAGNVLIGGIIGAGVDAATGATLSHYPNPVLIALQPENPGDPRTPPGRMADLEAKIKAEEAARLKKRQANNPGS